MAMNVEPDMSLRDWFAGQAMSGMLRFTPREIKRWSELEEWAQSVCVASIAYKIADQMMETRGRTDRQQMDRAIRDAYDRSGLDLSPCCECGLPVVCVPDGMPMCEACAIKEGEEQ